MYSFMFKQFIALFAGLLVLCSIQFISGNRSFRQRPDTEDTVKRHSRLMKQIISSLQFFSMFSHL